MSAGDVALVREMTSRCDWVWIEGNHDPKPPEDLGGRMANELKLGALVFRHEPTAGHSPGEIAGHLHPCVRVVGRGGRTVRARCFATDGERLVMPAYGALTGGLNVLDVAFDPLFPDGVFAGVLGRDGGKLFNFITGYAQPGRLEKLSFSPPASSTSTRERPSALRRSATTQPADPAPTTM